MMSDKVRASVIAVWIVFVIAMVAWIVLSDKSNPAEISAAILGGLVAVPALSALAVMQWRGQ